MLVGSGAWIRTSSKPNHLTKKGSGARIRTWDRGSKDHCLTAWPHPIIISLQNHRHAAIIACRKDIDKVSLLSSRLAVEVLDEAKLEQNLIVGYV
jgi:hypothetical protein